MVFKAFNPVDWDKTCIKVSLKTATMWRCDANPSFVYHVTKTIDKYK